MANSCRYRVARPDWRQEVVFAGFLKKLRETGVSDIYIAEFEAGQTGGDTSAELIAGYTNAFDSVDTTTLHILSSDAKDTVAGVGAQKVTIDYIKDNAICSKEFDMAGTSHSHIDDGTWDRIIGMRVTQVGSEGDPAGNIVLDVHATGTVYCTIPAASLYSITTRMWIPSGYSGTPISIQASSNNSGASQNTGLMVGVVIGASMNGTHVVTCGTHINDNCKEQVSVPIIPITGEKYMTIMQNSMDTTLNGEISVKVSYLIYKTPT